MTARDEAIEAGQSVYPYEEVADVIDAIPADVLVRLAIERGALKWVEVGSDIDGSIFIFGSGVHRTLEVHDSVLWWDEP